MDLKQVGKKIKLARVEQDLTQAELARQVNTQQKRISLYETGRSVPSLDALVRIARALGKPTSFFLD